MHGDVDVNRIGDEILLDRPVTLLSKVGVMMMLARARMVSCDSAATQADPISIRVRFPMFPPCEAAKRTAIEVMRIA